MPNVKWPAEEPLKEPIVKELANKYNKTAAQILLRFLVQQGVAVIPKAIKPERAKENINIFDFRLSPVDMQKLASVKTRLRFSTWNFAFGHPFFPFDDVDQTKGPVPLKS
ncbi:unnamed protein product [Cylicocyclus nassatus]|uniref:NADP-dependent oxidoreductase domain-containing protein n=1 Tax=Cylicocyclus nassatus TaxID=53992 RepID=A0AA36DKJ4_CYLNA|nr:unnamed protein product [Cylicocyclus nassatus]